jgi:hypothetical protein
MSSETNVQLFPGVFRSTVGGENPGFFLHSDGRVGIGNKAPTARPLWSSDDADRNKLNVTGHTHIDGNLNVTGYLYGDGSNLSGVAAVVGGYWDLDASNNNISYSAGNVGIGGAASTERLKVYGTVEATALSVGGTDISSTYATNTALTDGLATKQASGDFATNTALTDGLATKQDTGDFATNTALTDGLATKQDTGDFATNTALTDGLATKQASGSYFLGDTSNDVDVRLAAVHGRGVRFWDSDSYKIYMSSATDGTWGGRLGDSDYNMYFRMKGGTHRGFVFLNDRSVKCHINGNGDFYLNGGWLRTYGSRGWYSQTYGGGWFMQDTTYVRVHSNKVIYTGGSILAGGNVTAYSDIRRKKDLLKIDNALDKVEQLTGYTYTNKLDNKRYTGLIAQDVQKVLPEAVNTEELDGHLSLAYGNMMGLLVEAVKELTRKNEILEARLNAIENNR